MINDLVLDLSHWEEVRNWQEIKDAGYVGIIYKATEGSTYTDETYNDAKAGAEAVGLLWGSYHFLRPGDMVAQARFYVDYAGDCPLLCADHEDDGVSLEDLKDFLAEILRLTDKRAVIYSGHVIKEQLGDSHDAELARYRLWIAHYANEPEWPTGTWSKWWLWQYTETGLVPGIADETDINRYDGTADELRREWERPRKE